MADLPKQANAVDTLAWLVESVKRLQSQQARAPGTSGLIGPPGPTGATGPAGPTGPTGATGSHEGATRQTGIAAVSGNFTNAGCPVQMYATNDTSQPFQIGVTPSVDSWWPVEAMALLKVLDATWYRANVDLLLVPADVYGFSRFTVSLMHYGGLSADYAGGLVRAMWALAAGTPYTCYFQVGYVSGGTWNYYRGGQHVWLASDGAFPS